MAGEPTGRSGPRPLRRSRPTGRRGRLRLRRRRITVRGRPLRRPRRGAGRRRAGQPRLRQPAAVAELREGDTVLDLGSGGGLDVLLSARRVGPAGLVYGLDATPRWSSSPAATPPRPASPTSSSSTAPSSTSPRRRLRRRRDLQLRHRPGHRQGRRVRRDRPSPSARRENRDQRHRPPRRDDDDGTALPSTAAIAPSPSTTTTPLRRAGLTQVSIQPTDPSAAACTTPSSAPPKPRPWCGR